MIKTALTTRKPYIKEERITLYNWSLYFKNNYNLVINKKNFFIYCETFYDYTKQLEEIYEKR